MSQHRLLLTMLFNLLRCPLALLFLDVYIVVLAQYTTRLRKVHMLMFHDEVDGVASLPTHETVADIFRWTHHERRSLVIMERTQALVVDTSLLQRHVVLYYLDDRQAIEFVNIFIFNHSYAFDLTLQNYRPAVSRQKTVRLSATCFRHSRPQMPLLFPASD